MPTFAAYSVWMKMLLRLGVVLVSHHYQDRTDTMSDFAEWENREDDNNDADDDEVAVYNSKRHAMDDDRDLLKWWNGNKLLYPKLAKLARSVLCIPASNC